MRKTVSLMESPSGHMKLLKNCLFRADRYGYLLAYHADYKWQIQSRGTSTGFFEARHGRCFDINLHWLLEWCSTFISGKKIEVSDGICSNMTSSDCENIDHEVLKILKNVT